MSIDRRLVARLLGSGISAGMSPPATETPFGKIGRLDLNRTHIAVTLDIHVDERRSPAGMFTNGVVMVACRSKGARYAVKR